MVKNILTEPLHSPKALLQKESTDRNCSFKYYTLLWFLVPEQVFSACGGVWPLSERMLSEGDGCFRLCSACSLLLDSYSRASWSFLLAFFSFFRRFWMIAETEKGSNKNQSSKYFMIRKDLRERIRANSDNDLANCWRGLKLIETFIRIFFLNFSH